MVGIMPVSSVNCKPVNFGCFRDGKYPDPPSTETFAKVEKGIEKTCGVPLNEFIRVLEERKFHMEHPDRLKDDYYIDDGRYDVMV